MKLSVKAARAKRHQARMKKGSKLSLVALMDIFTILVFFLIVNSSSVEVLEADKSIKLPQSIAKVVAEDSLLLLITDKALILQGKQVATLSDVLASELDIIEVLSEELRYHKEREQVNVQEQEQEQEQELVQEASAITVMGDKSIEYSLLKRILLTCAKAGFGDISLAVEQIGDQVEGELQGEIDVQSQF